jgi:NAD(P)-dependent dehydrogenase (short-subunit alcohol dehydrogenase family)
MSARTWLITGTSRGFGRAWATAALARGDRVVGTARATSTTEDLAERYPDTFRALPLDVTDRAAVFAAVKQAHDHFGELDIVVNNAGYGHLGMIEEASEHEARAQLETNLFGALWVTQAALPYLRERGAGHIIQVSSIGGITAFPTLGLYHASKWGLEGFSQALVQEVKPFGINVTLIEPGGFSTDWAGSSAERSQPIHAYDELRAAVQRDRATEAPGDPAASATALLRIIDADEPPLRCFFGATPLQITEADYASRLETWRAWEPVAELAQG